jgi:hypothetical protein
MTATDDTLAYHETRSNLYLYPGQLCMKQEALQAYQNGIQNLETCLNIAMDEETEKTIRQKLLGAYCTIAELYVTDLCYEDNTETECERYCRVSQGLGGRTSSGCTADYVQVL